jgi:hypothetical protein
MGADIDRGRRGIDRRRGMGVGSGLERRPDTRLAIGGQRRPIAGRRAIRAGVGIGNRFEGDLLADKLVRPDPDPDDLGGRCLGIRGVDLLPAPALGLRHRGVGLGGRSRRGFDRIGDRNKLGGTLGRIESAGLRSSGEPAPDGRGPGRFLDRSWGID